MIISSITGSPGNKPIIKSFSLTSLDRAKMSVCCRVQISPILIRRASGDDLAVLISDGDPIARATGEGAANKLYRSHTLKCL